MVRKMTGGIEEGVKVITFLLDFFYTKVPFQ